MLWRYSLGTPSWRASTVTSVDYSTMILGYEINYLPGGPKFYSKYAGLYKTEDIQPAECIPQFNWISLTPPRGYENCEMKGKYLQINCNGENCKNCELNKIETRKMILDFNGYEEDVEYTTPTACFCI